MSNQHGERESTLYENFQLSMQYLSSLHKGISNGFVSLDYLQQRVSKYRMDEDFISYNAPKY